MKNLKLILAGLTLLGSSLVCAQGDRVGNGGDGVVCRNTDGKIVSARLLDYFEGEKLRYFSYNSIDKLGIKEIVDRTVGLLNRHDKNLVSKLKGSLDSLVQASLNNSSMAPGKYGNVLFTNEILKNVDDSDHILIPRGCDVEQLALKVNKQFSRDPEFIIQIDIWSKLSERDKAGLILHEAIYKYTSNLGQPDSRTARYFNQLVSADDFESTGYIDYVFFKGEAGMEMELHVDGKLLKFFGNSVTEHQDSGFWILKGTEDSYYDAIVLNNDGEIDLNRTKKASLKNTLRATFVVKSTSNISKLSLKIDNQDVCTKTDLKLQESFQNVLTYTCEFRVIDRLVEMELGAEFYTGNDSFLGFLLQSVVMKDSKEIKRNLYQFTELLKAPNLKIKQQIDAR